MFSKSDLKRLIIPLVIEQILAVTIGMADTVMVSSCGEAAVSGISLVDTINILLINIFSALATGGAVVASQYLGKKEPGNACIAAKQLLYSGCALSLVIMTISLIGNVPLLRLIFGQIEDDVMANAQTYFYMSALSYPFLSIYNSGAALFRAMGNSRISMVTSIGMNLINISGNAIFIFGFGMGVFGAALATLISRMVGAIVMMVLVQRKNNVIHVERIFHPEVHMGMIKNILHIGVPNGLENGMFQIGKILVQGLIASFGTTAIAANAVANTLCSMEVIPGSAISLSLITVVGQCVGAKDYDQARYYTKKLLKITYVSMGLLSLAIMGLSGALIGFFSLSAETATLAQQLLICHSIFCIFIWPASFTLPNCLRAANDVRFTMTVSIISMWACRIGMSYLLSLTFGLGVLGVWLAMAADWAVRGVIFILRFHGQKWQQKQLI